MFVFVCFLYTVYYHTYFQLRMLIYKSVVIHHKGFDFGKIFVVMCKDLLIELGNVN